jgi:rubrerythrin
MATLTGETVQMLLARSWRAVRRAQQRLGDLDLDIVERAKRGDAMLAGCPKLPNGRARLTREQVVDLLTDALLAMKDVAEQLETAGETEMAASIMWPLAAEVFDVRREAAGQLVLVCLECGTTYQPLAPPMKCPRC